MFPILDKLGGLDAALDVIERRRGRRLSLRAVQAWREYGFVPAINRLPLMSECDERGIPYADADFLPTKPVLSKQTESAA
jgi:hypothetical protein